MLEDPASVGLRILNTEERVHSLVRLLHIFKADGLSYVKIPQPA